MEDSIQLQVTFAFEDEIDLGEFFMIMRPRIQLDVDEVDRRDGIIGRGKGAARQAAWAGDRGDVVEVGDNVILAHEQDGGERVTKKISL